MIANDMSVHPAKRDVLVQDFFLISRSNFVPRSKLVGANLLEEGAKGFQNNIQITINK